MNIISIGSDRKLFEPGSEVRSRMVSLATVLGRLQVVVFAKRELGLQAEQVSEHLQIIPTNSSSRLGYVLDAIKIGKSLKRPEVITAQDPFESGWVAWRLAKYWQARLQLQLHTDFLSPYFAKQSFGNRVRVWLGKFLLPKADSVRAVSALVAESLERAKIKLNRPAIILPVWIDVERLRQSTVKTNLRQEYSQFSHHVLVASRLTWEKNIAGAIRAWSEVLEQYPQAGLIIVGQGPEEGKLKQLVFDLNLTTSVVFEPWTDDLPSYYKTATLFLNTSWYEGYGRTIAEALICGCPVVSTDVGAARELGAKLALSSQLASAIIESLANPVLPPATQFLSLPEYQSAYRAALLA